MQFEDLYPAADRAAHLVRRYGWTKDDCRQEAWFTWYSLSGSREFAELPSDADRMRYAGKAIQRWCLRKAKGRVYNALGAVEHPDGHDECALLELNDLVASAPALVRDYLTLRCIEGLTWDETRAAIGMSNDSLARLRHRSADWLLSQYES